ncbi:MAG: hypothetical protein A3G93_07850 [Nitrospinae bacterium RIFCSPLOWO2_12_FULL_45_22]|nr:MAG: hypothetical protein A3G93_07850 [Nitrospinae bacterium RIFCSPLOWO2_12_FULL_45_22]
MNSIHEVHINSYTPLELLNLYYSDGQCEGNKGNKLWQKMNSLLSWHNLLNHNYQSDLCPLLFYVITKALPKLNSRILQQDRTFDEWVPDPILAQLQKYYQNSLKRNIILLEELKQIIQELKKQGIQLVILKGAFLAENVYKNIACRPMSDLDILIRNADREKCYEILLNIGYRRIPESQQTETLHYKFFKDFLGKTVIIEIHHRLVKEKFQTNFNLEEILFWGYLPIEDHLVHLSWHAIRHGIIRLLWLCDIAQIIKNNKNSINWEVVSQKSISSNTKKQYILVVHLTTTLLMPSFWNNRASLITYPIHRISEVLFLSIQKKVKNLEDPRTLRYLLNMCLMRQKDLKKPIQQYIHYRLM